MPKNDPQSSSPMDFDSIRRLIDTLIEKQVEEFELEQGDLRIRIRRGAGPAIYAAGSGPAASAPTAAAPAPAATAAPAAAAAPEEGWVYVRSPIVGTFYAAPAPDAPEFVQEGDRVQPGQVLCIVEAMKLMNEIEAEVAGIIVRRLVKAGQPVEYGQPLFAIRP